MKHFNFCATDNFDLDNLKDIEKFIDSFPDFQTVTLNDESKLKALLSLIGIKEYTEYQISGADFSKYWDLSEHQLPEMNKEEFDDFYQKWLALSNRDNNMDEYGQLIFLRGLSRKWNKLKYRLVVK